MSPASVFFLDLVGLLVAFLMLARFLSGRVRDGRMGSLGMAAAIASFLGLTPFVYAITGVWKPPSWEVPVIGLVLFASSFIWMVARAPHYVRRIRNRE